MLLVGADEKGISVKLHDRAAASRDLRKKDDGLIFTDTCDDGTDIAIVKGRVVRVDNPSPKMGLALQIPITPHDGKGAGYPLLVETDEAPTPIADPFGENMDRITLAEQQAKLFAEASRLGFTISNGPAVEEGDTSSLINKKVEAGTVVAGPPPEATATDEGSTSDTGKSSKK